MAKKKNGLYVGIAAVIAVVAIVAVAMLVLNGRNDGDHVIITGEVYEKSPMYFIIKTTPEYVEVVEAAKE